MDKYLEFLSSSLHRERPDDKYVAVISNESGDLDSVCSATVLAFHLTEYTDVPHIPVLAFKRKELSLRTETLHAFEQQGLNPTKLIFSDDIESHEQQISTVILVDNHFINVSPLSNLQDKIRSIIDHRQYELPEGHYSETNVDMTIVTVGSCATLIAEKIFYENSLFDDKKALSLLRGCILLDTANMSPKAMKVTDKDEVILTEIERRLSENPSSRAQLYSDLETAKEDISGFDCTMLIRKDLKTINWPGKEPFPMAVSVIPKQDCFSILNRSDFNEHMEKLTNPWDKGYSLVILLGSGDPYDIMILGPHFRAFKLKILEALLSLQDAKMKQIKLPEMQQMNPALTQDFLSRHGIEYLTFENKNYSRKKLMPIIKEVISKVLDKETYDSKTVLITEV